MEYPAASNPEMVGKYEAMCFAGGGLFWDEVLEYRVWIKRPGNSPQFIACPTFELAQHIHDNPREHGIEPGEYPEKPLVLIKQLEWINEPSPGSFQRKSGERIAEWRPEWLEGKKREPDTIDKFMAEHTMN